MKAWLSLGVLAALSAVAWSLPSPLLKDDISEDATLTLPQLTEKYGYPSETHQVQTDDGYVLTLHRIPYGKNCGPDKVRKPPVLVQHGLLCSSIDWLVMGPQSGLGYILADHCYDVWLGNSRGNTQSKSHSYLDVSSAKFWEFSWHEMGMFDIPTVIDYILHATGKPNLHYVGHSQGTTQFFVMASQRPEYSEKVRSMHALAPVAYMNHLASPLVQILARFVDPIEAIADLIGLNEFLPKTEFLTQIGSLVCIDEHPKLQAMCADVLFLLCGFDSEQLNATMLPVIVGHTPAGASTKQFVHYAQGVTSKKFQQFDYGVLGNLKHYKQLSPPQYDLSKIRIPVALHYSDNDWMAAVKDVDRLATALEHTLIGKFRVPLDKFNHLDYMWAIDVKPLLYDRMINLMDRY